MEETRCEMPLSKFSKRQFIGDYMYMIVQGSFLLGGEGCLKVLGLGLFKGFVHLHVHVHVGYS